jgi:hypothetical protein
MKPENQEKAESMEGNRSRFTSASDCQKLCTAREIKDAQVFFGNAKMAHPEGEWKTSISFQVSDKIPMSVDCFFDIFEISSRQISQ